METVIDNLKRGMYIILPLKYQGKVKLDEFIVMGKEPVKYESSDFIGILSQKCGLNENFVRRYILDKDIELSDVGGKLFVTDIQLFTFINGIAFLAVYIEYANRNVGDMYRFIYPGYTDETEAQKSIQEQFLKDIEDRILSKIEPQMSWFTSNKNTESYILKEAYRLNVAAVPYRFKDLETIYKITYNEHRIVDLMRKFDDYSEKDVEYVTGAKDINLENYGWGCSITSQEISYVYALANKSLLERSEEDLLLLLLVMYQKYMCKDLNEKIHRRYMAKSTKSIYELKREALEFIAYGTLSPSQISRWHNVCELYRILLKLNGIDEALNEIKEKVNLLEEEQANIDSKRESAVSMIIAIFGLVSIVAALLQIVDYISSGRREILIGLASALGVMMLGGVLIKIFLFKRKRF